MNKGTKTAAIVFVLLVAVAVPLYFFVRPADVEEGFLQINGDVTNPLNLTVSELEAMPSSNMDATLDSSTHIEDEGTFTFTGVPVWTLLQEAGISDDATSVYIQAIDSYGTSLTVEEIQQNNQIMIVYKQDGEYLESYEEGGTGPLRLVIGSEEYAQLWVKNVVLLEVS
ncbi:MAG: molybdopterin-dependent oxidoreductase [archaeon]|nr:molybdopterin-dependent oxidoreductase [Candidatus Bathyarchaeum sp.]